MNKWLKRIIIVVLLAVFLYSAWSIGSTLLEYRKNDKIYEDAAEQFVKQRPSTGSSKPSSGTSPSDPNSGTTDDPGAEIDESNDPPLEVDFAALQAVNPDIVGWIYCEGTVINYPVLHGDDNDTYLRHLYDGTYSRNGSIFIEALNRKGFIDGNTIIYGHNMKNNSMFGNLDDWEKPGYYEEHPVIWLFTPEQDYRIDVLGGYTTDAYSDTYTIYQATGDQLDEYIEKKLAQSTFSTHESPEAGAKYVLLSTCSYEFDDARFVLHGKLVPVDSAGGISK